MQSGRGFGGGGIGFEDEDDMKGSGIPSGLGQVTEEELAKMTEAERQVYVESMRELVAKRLKVYRRAAKYLK